VSLGGTLVVALVGGSVGSGLAIAGGLIVQSRQHRFDHNQWRRDRMQAAVSRFGAAATAADSLFASPAWGEVYGDRDTLLNLATSRVDAIFEAVIDVHIAFGDVSHVSIEAKRVENAALLCRHAVSQLARKKPDVDLTEWNTAADGGLDNATLKLVDAIRGFIKAAREALFEVPATNTPQEGGQDGS
jgi:hypothetical protein